MAMRAYFGKDEQLYRLSSDHRDVNVIWDERNLNNGHTLIIGPSGSGKTTLLKKMLGMMQENLGPSDDVRFHIFDVHGDIEVPGASEVTFSELAPHGLNPLEVSPDPHHGGVRKCIQNFIRIVEKGSGNLGARQVAVLRKLLLDVYKQRGFDPIRPETWVVDPSKAHLVSDGSDNRLYLDIPFEEKDLAKEVAKSEGTTITWDGTVKLPGRNGLWWCKPSDYRGGLMRWLPMTVGRMHPTLDDVIQYAERLIRISFLGSDEEAISRLEIFQKAAKAHQKADLDRVKAGRNVPDGGSDSNSALERAKDKAMESYGRFLDAVRTGEEFENMIRYDSVEALKSCVDRMETLRATGLFKPKRPRFDPDAPVWTYKLDALAQEEKRMFTLFRLQELYYAAVQRGKCSRIRDVFVLDEAHIYVEDGANNDDIISTIAREARKFGVAIIAANQDADLPLPFITSLATKIVLGMARTSWTHAINKMGMTQELLKYLKPKITLLVQMDDSSPYTGQWRQVTSRRPAAAPATPATRELAAAGSR